MPFLDFQFWSPDEAHRSNKALAVLMKRSPGPGLHSVTRKLSADFASRSPDDSRFEFRACSIPS